MWGGGAEYLSRYWIESVVGRIHSETLESHFGPLMNLLKVYWPWFPFWIWGTMRCLLSLRGQHLGSVLKNPINAPSLAALTIFGGFTYSGHFLEHYLVPFYPFAAGVVAEQIAEPLAHWSDRILKSLLALLVGYAMILAAFPLHVHGEAYREPLRRILTRMAVECDPSQIQRLQVSTGVADIWFGTAVGLWYTPWDVYSGTSEEAPVRSSSDLLLASRLEQPHSGWAPTVIAEGDLRVFVRRGIQVCPTSF